MVEMKKKEAFVRIEIEIPQSLYNEFLKIVKTEREVKNLIESGVKIFFTEICTPKDLLEALKINEAICKL